MRDTLLQTNTGKSELYEPGEYHLNAAATEPRRIAWFGQKARRWHAFIDPNRTRNLPWVSVTRVTSKGPHDLVEVLVDRSSMNEALFSLYHESPSHWSEREMYQSIVHGPALSDRSGENATIQDVEDLSLSKEFIDFFYRTLAEISRLADLCEGWDSYGASRVEPGARRAAIRLLSLMHTLGRAVPSPIVSASPSGAVILQWVFPHIEVFTEASSEDYEYYAAHPDKDGVLQAGTVDQPEELAQTLLQFLSKTTT